MNEKLRRQTLIGRKSLKRVWLECRGMKNEWQRCVAWHLKDYDGVISLANDEY
jgi:hypothetical protein